MGSFQKGFCDVEILRELESQLTGALARINAMALRTPMPAPALAQSGLSCNRTGAPQPMSQAQQASWMETASQAWMAEQRERATQMRRQAEATSTQVSACTASQLTQFERELDAQPLLGRGERALASFAAEGTAIVVGTAALVELAPAAIASGATGFAAAAEQTPNVVIAGGQAAARVLNGGVSLLLRGARQFAGAAAHVVGRAMPQPLQSQGVAAAAVGAVGAVAVNTNEARAQSARVGGAGPGVALGASSGGTTRFVVLPMNSGGASFSACYTDGTSYDRMVARASHLRGR